MGQRLCSAGSKSAASSPTLQPESSSPLSPTPLRPHPLRSIVSMLDIFEIDNNTFATVLELCEGGDLESYLKLHEVGTYMYIYIYVNGFACVWRDQWC